MSLGIVMEYHPITLEDFLKRVQEDPTLATPQDLYNMCIQVCTAAIGCIAGAPICGQAAIRRDCRRPFVALAHFVNSLPNLFMTGPRSARASPFVSLPLPPIDDLA
jgi:hypothetical protein